MESTNKHEGKKRNQLLIKEIFDNLGNQLKIIILL